LTYKDDGENVPAIIKMARFSLAQLSFLQSAPPSSRVTPRDCDLAVSVYSVTFYSAGRIYY
jgi:hypothetical protein